MLNLRKANVSIDYTVKKNCLEFGDIECSHNIIYSCCMLLLFQYALGMSNNFALLVTAMYSKHMLNRILCYYRWICFNNWQMFCIAYIIISILKHCSLLICLTYRAYKANRACHHSVRSHLGHVAISRRSFRAFQHLHMYIQQVELLHSGAAGY